MVRHPDGISATIKTSLCIIGVEDALDDEWATPLVTDLGQVVVGQRAAQARSDKASDVLHGRLVDVFLEGAESRQTVTQHAHGPRRVYS